MTTIAPDKLEWLKTVRFGKGLGTPEHPCVEAALCLALGLPFSDSCPDCVDPMLHRAGIRVNDSWAWESDAERTEVLMPLLLAQPGTRTDDAQVKAIRLAMVVDFATKRAVPAWLRLSKMEKEALRCEALPSWSVEAKGEIRAAMREVRAAAYAAAYDAADAAAGAAADAAAADAYDAADAAADAAAKRPLAKELLREFVGVLIAACRVQSSPSADRTP